MEARVAELTAAVDAGDLRQAIRLANQFLLRTQKHIHSNPAEQLHHQQIIKSIKVIILTRQGKSDEAIDLLQQLPKEDPDLNAFLSVGYKELRNSSRLSPCRVAALPHWTLAECREEVKVLDMFNSLAMEYDVFQVWSPADLPAGDALRLYGATRKPCHLLWTVMAALISTRHPGSRKRLQLAQQLLRQLPLPSPPKDLSPQSLQDPMANIQLKDANASMYNSSALHPWELPLCVRSQRDIGPEEGPVLLMLEPIVSGLSFHRAVRSPPSLSCVLWPWHWANRSLVYYLSLLSYKTRPPNTEACPSLCLAKSRTRGRNRSTKERTHRSRRPPLPVHVAVLHWKRGPSFTRFRARNWRGLLPVLRGVSRVSLRLSRLTLEQTAPAYALLCPSAALMVHLSVLRQCNKTHEALELLKNFRNCCLQPGDLSALRIQLLTESGNLDEALAEAAKAISDPYVFVRGEGDAFYSSWTWVERVSTVATEFLGAYVRLAAARGEEATTKAFEKLRSMSSFEAATAALDLLVQRGLELVGGYDRMLSAHGFEALWEAVKPHGDPVESLFSFMKEHGSHYCAFRFFRSYAGRLSVSQRLRLRRLLLELHPGLLAAAEVAEATHQDLRSLITLDKALLALGEWSRRTAGAAARLQEWRRLFLQHGNRQRMESLSADLIGMSVEVFMRWDRELEDPRSAGDQQEKDPWARRRYLFEALSLVEAGLCVEPLRTSPMLHQIRVGLSFLVGDTYAIHQSFAAMEVKQILLLSMGLYLTAAQQDYGHLGNMAQLCRSFLDTREEVATAYTDYLSAAVEEGSFSWLPEFRLWGLITQHSLDGLLVTLQDALYRLYERGGFGPSDLLFNVPTEPAMADLVRGGALRARALNRGPLEWWLTTMAVMPPVADAWGEAVGALGGLTCSDLGASCISLLPPEELHARELTHPIRRALVLHKTRKIVLKRASPTQQAAAEGEDVQSINKEQQQTAGAPGEQEGPCEAAILEATFQAEEKALFAVWQANLCASSPVPLFAPSLSTISLSFSRASFDSNVEPPNHALTRHNFIQGPPRPDVSLTAGAPGTAETLTGEAGDRQLYVPWLSDGEREVLDALASGSLGASRQDQEGEGGGHRCGKREDEGQPPSPSLEKRADCSWNWTVPWCSAPHCAARRHPKEPLTGACEGERPRGAPQESLPDENGAKNAADVLSGAEGAFKEAVSSLRRSIPGRARRLRLLFAVLRPSVGFNEEQLREMDRFVAELKQVIDGPHCGCVRSSWPSASSRHTEALGTSRCISSTSHLLGSLYSHQCAILAVLKEACELRNSCADFQKGVSTEATVAVSNHLCEALDGCRDCMMACCTAILDGIGELKGLGRPLLAGENVRLSLFDALFVLSQVGVVSLALIGTLFQQLALADAMDTAVQLEPMGRAPWVECAGGLRYDVEGDTHMEDARQRVRMKLCSSYMDTAQTICRILQIRTKSASDLLDGALFE
ncbi:hypothetical protein cyc_04620 [Cyclospora cayetanensis]|uniref:Uncharacterized protein n=1 Tax=Cyclospora cayetanensis TaxID=88456 RepID=A0A1D3D4C3_9EIME|nr:hypothetical protein cyc_04620 [Cyclospora cayetanensis]